MWISRQVWEKTLIEFAESRGREAVVLERLDKFTDALAKKANECQMLRARVKEIEGALLAANDALYSERKAAAQRPTSIQLDSVFEEDDGLVEADRRRIDQEGTSDTLLAEMDS